MSCRLICRWFLMLSVLAGCSSRQNLSDEVIDQKFVHNGAEVPQAHRGENGKVIVSLKNGVIITRNFVNGKQEGETTYTFPHCDAVECSEFYSKAGWSAKSPTIIAATLRRRCSIFLSGSASPPGTIMAP